MELGRLLVFFLMLMTLCGVGVGVGVVVISGSWEVKLP